MVQQHTLAPRGNNNNLILYLSPPLCWEDRNRGRVWLPKTRIVNPNYEDDDDRDDILLCDSNGDSRPDRRILHPRLPRGFPHRPLVSVEERTTVREEFPEAQGGEKDDCRLRGIVQSASLGTFGND